MSRIVAKKKKQKTKTKTKTKTKKKVAFSQKLRHLEPRTRDNEKIYTYEKKTGKNDVTIRAKKYVAFVFFLNVT